MAFFVSLLILCCVTVAFLYVSRSKRAVHYVFIVRNQQNMIEGYIRNALLKNYWRSVIVYVTVIDVHSTDLTLKVAHSLTHRYPLQILDAPSQEAATKFVQRIIEERKKITEIIIVRACS